MSCPRSLTRLLLQRSLGGPRPVAPATVTAWRAAQALSAQRLCSAARAFSTHGTLNAKAGGKGIKPRGPAASSPSPAPQASPAPTRPPTLRRRVQPPPEDEPPSNPYMDLKGKDYKRAARSYTGLVVGMPFLIVSSIFLYQRGKSMHSWPPTTKVGGQARL